MCVGRMIRAALWFVWRQLLEPLSFLGLKLLLVVVVLAIAGRGCR